MSNLTNLSRCLAWLQCKGFDEVEMFCEARFGEVKIIVMRSDINEVQLRLLKRHFGPLEIQNSYASKDLKGCVKMEDGLRILLLIDSVYSCTKLDPAGITEEKWDEIKEKVRDGLVEIQDCTAVEQGEML